MNEFDKLELSTETIRELSVEEMGQVAGGGARESLLPSCKCASWGQSVETPCISDFICTG